MSLLGRFFVATPSGRSCLCASQTGTARSPTWIGSNAQLADTQNASGRPMTCVWSMNKQKPCKIHVKILID